MAAAMRYLVVLLLAIAASGQTEDPAKYAPYFVMLVPAERGAEGFAPFISKEQKLVFVPISAIAKTMSEGGVPIRYGDVLQLLRQLTDENQRLKTENERLWRIAEKSSSSPSPPPVIVQTPPAPPAVDPDLQRRQMQMMLLRSLLVPRSTVNLNVTDCSRYPASCVGR